MQKLVPTGKVQISGTECRFFATDGAEQFEIRLPLADFVRLASEAQTKHSIEQIKASETKSAPKLALNLRLNPMIEIASAATMEPPGLALIIDRGTPQEVGIALSRNAANLLAEQLLSYSLD